MKKTIVFSILVLTTLAACKTKEKSVTEKAVEKPKLDCTGKAYAFNADIKPIMYQYCVSCHNTNFKAGYNFQQESSVKKAAQSGHLLGTIKHEHGFSNMPAMSAKLDQSIIDKIECWINNGMK